ncbi:MAG TPA: class I SAM-dependent methyltransferase [Bryobacteraceae bacterium]|jgi:SAM-dependent methyltransferase
MTEAPARRQFLEDYARIRSAEGRGSQDDAYYRALPFEDLTGHNAAQWQIRARTFRYFANHILPQKPCDILDLGAGNCWLSHRLKERGHASIALDIFADPQDGLRARRHYPHELPAVEAEFDRLPFADARFDLILFNSSIHYSADYACTLSEARRCLRKDGRVVILDSPVYQRREHGETMRAERQQFFERQYGFRSDALGSIEYFDLETLHDLARQLKLTWEIRKPWYGWQWHLRPLRARLKKQRPPSRFWILVGRFG